MYMWPGYLHSPLTVCVNRSQLFHCFRSFLDVSPILSWKYRENKHFVMVFLEAAFTHLLVWSSCSLCHLTFHTPLSEALAEARVPGSTQVLQRQAAEQGPRESCSQQAYRQGWHDPIWLRGTVGILLPLLCLPSHVQQPIPQPSADAAASLWCTHESCAAPHQAVPTWVPTSPRTSYMPRSLQSREQLLGALLQLSSWRSGWALGLQN